MQRWSSPHFEWIGLSQLRARRKPVDTTTSSHNPLVRRCESKPAQSSSDDRFAANPNLVREGSRGQNGILIRPTSPIVSL